MNKFFKRGRGFTLIEVLIVIAILGVLAAVVIPNIHRVISGERAEPEIIQAAVTEMMKDKGIISLLSPILSKQATSNMAIFPEPRNPIYPDYLEEQVTKLRYWVEIDGTVHQASP